MATLDIEKKRNKKIFGNDFQNDALSFEELEKLKKIKKDMINGEYCSFEEVFDNV